MTISIGPCLKNFNQWGISGETLVEHPLWILLPWTVFVVAAGTKLWRVGTGLRRHLAKTATSTDQFRRSLERIWAKTSKTP